jgi:hypothetical protein
MFNCQIGSLKFFPYFTLYFVCVLAQCWIANLVLATVSESSVDVKLDCDTLCRVDIKAYFRLNRFIFLNN